MVGEIKALGKFPLSIDAVTIRSFRISGAIPFSVRQSSRGHHGLCRMARREIFKPIRLNVDARTERFLADELGFASVFLSLLISISSATIPPHMEIRNVYHKVRGGGASRDGPFR